MVPSSAESEVDGFIQQLASARIGRCCNFYSDDCDDTPFPTLAGRTNGPAERRANLRQYLLTRWGAPDVLVGEAPGYRGARLSGVPFTSQFQLENEGQKEATATVVHRVLSELRLEEEVLLWNVVPLHPHKPMRPRSNRHPTAEEVRASDPWLRWITRDRRVLAIGRIAETATLGRYVRHPANGGAMAFRDDLRKAILG